LPFVSVKRKSMNLISFSLMSPSTSAAVMDVSSRFVQV
jgi:hypothetical protein